MATAEEGQTMEHRGLLTSDDRQFYQGEKDVDDPDKTAREKRYRVRRRIENIAEDLDILRESEDGGDLVEEFYNEIGRYSRLESEIQRLRQELEEND